MSVESAAAASASAQRLALWLRLLAPYVAVVIFWSWLQNAWLAVAAYHLQILLWHRFRLPRPRATSSRRVAWAALGGAAVGPLFYLLLPVFCGETLAAWCHEHLISRRSLLLALPYFGLIHPWLEQLHWAPLRERTALSHPLFAGYHLLVLVGLASRPWLLLSFLVLSSLSWGWGRLTRSSGSLYPAYAFHAAADLGIVIAAILRL